MRWQRLAFAALSLALSVPDAVPPARAEDYPVCMEGGYDSRALHCDFSNFDQCRATASGIGGSCTVNPNYTPPPAATRSRPARRHR